jgi:hypothetical protein
MKQISSIWTLVYKEKGGEPLAFSYKSEKDANLAKLMVEESEGQEIINDSGEIEGYLSYEWIYLINGKLIESSSMFSA